MKNLVKLSFTLVLAVITLTGCNCFKKMAKNVDSVEVKCTPEVLVLNNGKVKATIAINFPDGYFDDDATVKVTPAIVYEGGEVTGTPFFYQGSKVNDNYKIITDGTVSEIVEFNYSPEMRLSKLQLRVEVKCKGDFELLNLSTGKVISSSEQKILEESTTSEEALAILNECGYDLAEGINTLQQDIKQEDVMRKMDSGYKRVTNTVEKSEVVYSMSSSQVNSRALSSESVKTFKAIIAANSKNDRATQKLSAQGYASPDGPVKFNDRLSKARSESTKKEMVKFLSDYGLAIDAASYGEDWEGFKELVENSNIEDKNLILQVLSLYDSSTQREEEIKNMSAVFSALRTEVLPQLRRTKMINSVDLIGKSDEEMMALVNTKNYEGLTLLEILHITDSEYVPNAQDQIVMLEYAAQKYNDGVAYNNLGVVLAKENRADDALKAFNSAAKCGANSAEVGRNLALAYLMKGNVREATPYAMSADPKAKSCLSAAEGEYAPAAKELEGYNKAIALVMTNDYSGAEAALANCDSADASYLRAVIASLQGDVSTSETHLKDAISKDASLSEKAATDVNLANLFSHLISSHLISK